MKDQKKPVRPVFHMGRVTVRAIRGPDEHGRFYWRTFRYEGGKEHKRALGWLSRADAEDAAEEVRKRTTTSVRDDVRNITDLMECWMGAQEDRTDLKPKTLNALRYSCGHVKDTIGEVPVGGLDLTTVERYRNIRQREGAAASTIRHELGALRMAWGWGQELGACPARKVPRVPVKGGAVYCDYTPTAVEVAKVLAKLEERLQPTRGRPLRDWPLVYLLLEYAMGARAGEIAALEWADIELEEKDGIVHLGRHEGNSKTGPRDFPIEGTVVTRLRAWRLRARGDRVFPVAIESAIDRLDRAHLPAACAAAGVPRFTLKGFRKLLVDTFARSKGKVDPATAASLMGHSPTTMWEYYRKVNDADRRSAVKAMRLGAVPQIGRVISMDKDAP